MMFHKKNLCSLLPVYFDGQMGQEDVARFKAHLKHCPHCQGALRRLNTVSDFIKTTQGVTPDKTFFDSVWERVEEKLIREKLSIFQLIQGWADGVYYYSKLFFKPAFAICFVLLLVILPHLERKGSDFVTVVPRAESEIKRIASNTNVMLVTTKQKRWKVIWVMSTKQEGGKHNAQKTHSHDDNDLYFDMRYHSEYITGVV